eukprot:scaffold101913_cov16-Tisochrysis_lutea.AAC.2
MSDTRKYTSVVPNDVQRCRVFKWKFFLCLLCFSQSGTSWWGGRSLIGAEGVIAEIAMAFLMWVAGWAVGAPWSCTGNLTSNHFCFVEHACWSFSQVPGVS